MDSIKLIRNWWFLLSFLLVFSGIIWASFQLVYRKELLIQDMYRSNEPPDVLQVIFLYNKMMKSAPKRNEIDLYYRLSQILMRIGKKKEAVRVLNRLVKTFPEDRSLRLSLAVELHNQKRYREAEKHFVVLLRGKN
jgi:tetratricopeptide (TPR) repeat protein